MSMIRKVLPGRVGLNRFANTAARPATITKAAPKKPDLGPKISDDLDDKVIGFSPLHQPMRVRMERAVPRRIDG